MKPSGSQLKNIIKAAIFTPGINDSWGLPLILWGGVGIGKTSKVQQMAREFGLGYASMVGSIIEPTDVAGMYLPARDPEVRAVEQMVAQWVYNANAAEGHVQLFDELTGCPPAVQSAFLRIILERRAGEVPIDKRVRFIAAANPTDMAANGSDLSMPLANRFGHIVVAEPSVDEWVDYMTVGAAGGQGPAAHNAAQVEEERVMAGWARAFARSMGALGGFMRRRPDLLNAPPKVADPNASGAFPTPRSWEMAVRALAGSDIHALSGDERFIMVSSFVGEGATRELTNFLIEADLPDPVDLLTRKLKWTFQEKRMDRTFAVLQMCTTYLIQGKEKVQPKDKAAFGDMVLAMWEFMADVAGKQADVTSPAVWAMTKMALDDRVNQAVRPIQAKLSPIITKIAARSR